MLSRQNLRTVDRTTHGAASGVEKGAYILKESSTAAKVTIIATGSEVGIALDAQIALEAEGVATRVVSAPCLEWFNEESESLPRISYFNFDSTRQYRSWYRPRLA